MIVTRIQIEPYVAQYYMSMYWDREAGGVHFPPGSDIYVTIYDLMQKRPAGVGLDSGNFPIVLPDRRDANRAGGKSPEQFNYLSHRAASIIGKRLKIAFWAQVHELMDEQRHLHGFDYKDIVYKKNKIYVGDSKEDVLLTSGFRNPSRKTYTTYGETWWYGKYKYVSFDSDGKVWYWYL